MTSNSYFGNILRLVFCLLIGVVLFGCSRKDNTVLRPDKNNISYKYNENVISLTKKYLSFIEDVTEKTIIFSKETPNRFLPKVDDIITSGINDKFPHGIGIRVTAVHSLPNGNYECITTPASLDQIFDDLVITSHTTLFSNNDGFVQAIDKDGNEIALKVVTTADINTQRSNVNKNYLFVNPLSLFNLSLGKNHSEISIEIPFHTQYEINPHEIDATIDGISLGKTQHYNFSGNIHAGIGLIYECNLKARTFKLAIDANCGFEISEWLFENEVSLSKSLFDLTIINQYIDLGPVVINPTIHLVLDAEAYHSGYFRCQASKDVGIEMGITQDGAYQKTISNGNEDKIFQIDSLNAKVGACFPFHPNVVVGFYDERIVNGKLEPTISFGVETDCQLEDDTIFKTSPTLKLYTRGNIAASVNLLEGFKYSISKSGETQPLTFWEKGWPLLPVLDATSLSIVPKKSGEEYLMSFKFSSDGILQKWRDNMRVGALIVSRDSLIQKQPSSEGDIISAKNIYKYTFNNLSLNIGQSYMARPEISWNGRKYHTNGISFAVNGVTFNTKEYYIKSVKYYEAYSDEDYGCDFWERDHYHYYHDLIFDVSGSERCAEIGNQCTTDDYHRELSLSLHDGILKGQYVYLTTNKVSSFMVETVPYAYLLDGEKLTFEPYQFRLWRDESIISQWYK